MTSTPPGLRLRPAPCLISATLPFLPTDICTPHCSASEHWDTYGQQPAEEHNGQSNTSSQNLPLPLRRFPSSKYPTTVSYLSVRPSHLSCPPTGHKDLLVLGHWLTVGQEAPINSCHKGLCPVFTPRSPCLNRSRSCADPMVSTLVCGDTGLRGAAAGDDWTSQIGYICLPSPVIFVRWLFVTRCIIPITCCL